LLDGLVFCMAPLDGTSSPNYDLTGRGNTLTKGGSGAVGIGGNPAGGNAPAGNGPSVDYELSNSQYHYRASTGDCDFRNTSCTFNSFIKLETAAIQAQIMGSGQYGNPTIQLYVDVSVFRFLFSYNFGSVVQATGGSPSTNWQMVTGRVDRRSSTDLRVRLFVDGAPVDVEYTGTNDLQADVTGNFSMGARPALADWFFDGLMWQPSAWKRALSDDEIKQLWNRGQGLAYPYYDAP